MPKESEFEKSRPGVPWVKWTQDTLDKADARHRDVSGPGQLGCVAAMAAYVRTDDVNQFYMRFSQTLMHKYNQIDRVFLPYRASLLPMSLAPLDIMLIRQHP